MAQNWNLKQAYAAIKNDEKDSMIDIGRRFPLAMAALIKVGESDAIENLFNTFPDHLTMRKIENALREGVKVDDSDNDVEEEAVATETEETEEAVEETGEIDYKKMTGRQVYELLRDKGLYKDCVAKMGGGNKKQMLEYIDKYGLDGGSEEAEAETEEDVEEEKTEGYEAMSAMELFKECKKRGIKIKPRQKAAVYVEALKKDDAAKAEPESEEEESWEEEEKEEKKPEKSEKKATARPKATAKKTPKKEDPEEEEDDDDDWDI